jgi:hypothetical protein
VRMGPIGLLCLISISLSHESLKSHSFAATVARFHMVIALSPFRPFAHSPFCCPAPTRISLSLPLTFGIVSRSDLQACNLRALTGPQWPKNRVSAGSRSVNYKSFCINA